MHHEAQPTPHDQVKQYKIRIVVAGSRSYNNYTEFVTLILDYLTRFKGREDQLLFISGKAPRGADAMVIRFAKEHQYRWAEYPADWDNLTAENAVNRTKNGKTYNARAGHDRNETMAVVGTHALIFWDGMSTGTNDMIKRADRRNLNKVTILVHPDNEEKHYGGKSQSSGSRDSEMDRQASTR